MLDHVKLDPENQDKLKKLVTEAVNSMERTDGEKRLQKDIAERAKEELEIPAPFFKKLVKIAYNNNAKKLNDETTTLLDYAEVIGVYSHNSEEE